MPRLALTVVPRTKFLLLKAPVSTAYEEKYGDRNVFTVSMYVQRLIAKEISVGLVIDCTALDLRLFDTSAIGSTFYFHNSADWDDFGIDYHRLVQKENSSQENNSGEGIIISPTTIQEFINICSLHWRSNPTLHISVFDSRGGQGAASFLIAHYLCQKLKAPVHTALAMLGKSSPKTTCNQTGLYDLDMIKQLQKSFNGKKDIVINRELIPSWWYSEDTSLIESETETVVISAMEGKRRIEDTNDSGIQETNKKPKPIHDQASSQSLPLRVLSADSQRHKRAITVLMQLTNRKSILSEIPTQTESTLTEENLHLIKRGKYKVTFRSIGRQGMLLILSDGVFFLENEIDGIKVSVMTCPLYFPDPQRPSNCQHRTLLTVTLVVDREGETLVPRFLVSDILTMSSGMLMHKPFSHRLKYIADGIILARKKSVNIWNYSKELIRIRAKDFFCITQLDFVLEKVINSQTHDTCGLYFFPEEGHQKQSGFGSSEGGALLCNSDDKVMIQKLETAIGMMN